MDFDSTNYQKNEYAFPIEEMVENIDYVRAHLENWTEYLDAK
jgi:hypothetical protein